MELNQALKHVSVIGAAGKMGRGIALLLLQEMARVAAEGKKEEKNTFCLQLIDVNDHALFSLQNEFKEHLIRYAEKNINALRRIYRDEPELVSNEDIINAFVERALEIVRYETDYENAHKSFLIFEAIVENIEIKSKVLSGIFQNSHPETILLSNTSSIPISVLNEKGNLGHRIIGFHFYNPPAVQKLVELILPEQTVPAIEPLAYQIAERLQKIVVRSADVAGFIGNGQFIREILFACQKVREFEREFSLMEAVYLVNRVTQEWLIRPMGTFQLLDYVGVDICKNICDTMQAYLPQENFHDDIIEMMNQSGVIGGQYFNSLQKNGFFQYERNVPVGIYSLKDKQYHLFDQEHWKERLDNFVGPLPNEHIPWKKLHKDPEKNAKLKNYFHALNELDTFGAELARNILRKSKEIAQKLVETGVAQNLEDVNQVMVNGFYHLYGPENPWVPHHSHASFRSQNENI